MKVFTASATALLCLAASCAEFEYVQVGSGIDCSKEVYRPLDYDVPEGVYPPLNGVQAAWFGEWILERAVAFGLTNDSVRIQLDKTVDSSYYKTLINYWERFRDQYITTLEGSDPGYHREITLIRYLPQSALLNRYLTSYKSVYAILGCSADLSRYHNANDYSLGAAREQIESYRNSTEIGRSLYGFFMGRSYDVQGTMKFFSFTPEVSLFLDRQHTMSIDRFYGYGDMPYTENDFFEDGYLYYIKHSYGHFVFDPNEWTRGGIASVCVRLINSGIANLTIPQLAKQNAWELYAVVEAGSYEWDFSGESPEQRQGERRNYLCRIAKGKTDGSLVLEMTDWMKSIAAEMGWVFDTIREKSRSEILNLYPNTAYSDFFWIKPIHYAMVYELRDRTNWP